MTFTLDGGVLGNPYTSIQNHASAIVAGRKYRKIQKTRYSVSYIKLNTGEVVKVMDYHTETTLPSNARLFFNLGKYTSVEQIPENWVRSGLFREVKNIDNFLLDPRMKDVAHIEHHNFKWCFPEK